MLGRASQRAGLLLGRFGRLLLRELGRGRLFCVALFLGCASIRLGLRGLAGLARGHGLRGQVCGRGRLLRGDVREALALGLRRLRRGCVARGFLAGQARDFGEARGLGRGRLARGLGLRGRGCVAGELGGLARCLGGQSELGGLRGLGGRCCASGLGVECGAGLGLGLLGRGKREARGLGRGALLLGGLRVRGLLQFALLLGLRGQCGRVELGALAVGLGLARDCLGALPSLLGGLGVTVRRRRRRRRRRPRVNQAIGQTLGHPLAAHWVIDQGRRKRAGRGATEARDKVRGCGRGRSE